MSTISARVLELLALLQSRRHWSGEELARRLEVSPRTLRRDVESLQDLGYPITTLRGTGGGYQLAPGGSLPPLVLNEDEAVAVVIALKEAATGAQPVESSAAVTALAKIVQVLPGKIRRRIDSLQRIATLPSPNQPLTPADTVVLTTCALAARDHEVITFGYSDAHGNETERHVQPHHVVSVHRRLYLVGYDLGRDDWRSFRIDRAANAERTGRTFTPKPLPISDPAEFVRTQIKARGASREVTATVELPANLVEERLGDWGSVVPLSDGHCTVRIPAGDLDWAVFALAALHAPFTIHSPAEAIMHASDWAKRLTHATRPSTTTAG